MLSWKDEFSIGIASVDHEHRQMISMINDTLIEIAKTDGKSSDQVDTVLERLGDVLNQTSAHFALEEKEMLRRGFPEYELHKAEHESLLDILLEMIAEVEASSTLTAATLFSDRLSDWFSTHFREYDARLHAFFAIETD